MTSAQRHIDSARIPLWQIFLAFFAFFPSLGEAYQQVTVEKTVPLTDKKASYSLLRVDSEGGWWSMSQSDRALHRLSEEGGTEISLATDKTKEPLFKRLADFTFTSKGYLVLLDDAAGKLSVVSPFDPASASTEPVKPNWGSVGVVASVSVKDPTAVAVSMDGAIAVASGGGKYLQIYSSEGAFLYNLFSSAKHPFLSISQMSYTRDGVLWVLDGKAGKLHRFASDRKWLGITSDLASSNALAVDDYGYAYVLLSKGRWKEINRDGKVTGTFGTKGRNPGQMSAPTGAALLDHERLLVMDNGNRRLQLFLISNKDKKAKLIKEPAVRLQLKLLSEWADTVKDAHINTEGRFLLLSAKKNQFEWVDTDGNVTLAWTSKGRGNKGFRNPVALAADSTGKIWVADGGDHQIKEIAPTGEITEIVGEKGRTEGSLTDPVLLAIRDDGSFVVVDKGGTRVQVLGKDGLFLFTVGSAGENPGQFKSITGVACNRERIILADNARKSLLFFDGNGKYVGEIANKKGTPPYWQELSGVSCDPDGRIYALDKSLARVRIFTSVGKYLTEFSAAGHKLVFGPHREALLAGDRSVRRYSIDFIPRATENLKSEDRDGELLVTWSLNPESEVYRVYRSTDSTTYELLTSTSGGSIMDSNLIPGTMYAYAVLGVNRLGTEGDWAATAPIKASRRKDVSLVSISNVSFQPVFTAAFKYYVDHPIGSLSLKNNNNVAYRNVKISLSLKRYTDFATEKIVETMDAGATIEVPVTMTFNDTVLELTEDTPVQVEIRATYFEENGEKSISQNAPLMLYSRNAINWLDKARIASFITPRDTPVVEFSREAIRAFLAELKGSTVGKPLAKAALFYEAMNALDISYVPDPKTPYNEVSGKPDILDYVQFPRETLRRKTGDCDDTTALLASLLGSIGVETALVDTPGHIFLMANLEENDPDVIGLPAERFVEFNGTYWVPIETTKLKHDFLEAWQAAISEVQSAKSQGKVDFIPVLKAAEKYPPVTLVEKDDQQPPFPEDRVKTAFLPILKKMQDEKYALQTQRLKDAIQKNPGDAFLKIQLGMAHIEGGYLEDGEAVFNDLANNESAEIASAAHNNLGNLFYLKGEYQKSAEAYKLAADKSPDDGGVLINQARAAWRLGDKKTAQKMLSDAKGKVPDWREYVSDMPAELLPK